MDHADLVRELPQIERMTNQERLKLAHNRRKHQLKVWTQYEKGCAGKATNRVYQQHQQQESFKTKASNGNVSKTSRTVQFRNSIMLLEAAGRNDVNEVRRLLQCGISPDVANEDGLTALHQCCIDDNEEMMRLLFVFGVNVNSEDSEKWTPLHASATCGHLHLVKQLIAKGANLLAVNGEGNMPYDICDDEATLDCIESEMAKRGVTQELIEEIRALPETKMLQDMQIIQSDGGDLENRDPRDGATYLHIAAANGYLRVVEFLLDHHVATDAVDYDYWQPIHAAACWNHIDVLELLVQNGADLNARTKNNETPYAICEDSEIKERIIQLRSEQETLRNSVVKKIKRSQSSNSRTHSIRRTSQREKGLTSKRDVADEAQKRLTVTEIDPLNQHLSHSDLIFPVSEVGFETNRNVMNIALDERVISSAEDDADEDILLTSLPPVLMMGRDSITQLHSNEDLNFNKRENKRQHAMHVLSKDEELTETNIKNLKSTSLQSSTNLKERQGFNKVITTPGVVNNLLSKGNLTTPEINPSIEIQPQLSRNNSGGGLTVSGSNDDLSNTIDIHVQVTINTNRTNNIPLPSSGSINSTYGSHVSHVSNSTNTLYSPPGTLADLKKQRSLQYININNRPINNNNVTQYNALDSLDLPPKYELPPSPSLSLKRFTGDPGEIVGDSSENRKKCCNLM